MKETWSDTIKQMVKKAGKGKILLLIAVGVLLLLVSIKDSGRQAATTEEIAKYSDGAKHFGRYAEIPGKDGKAGERNSRAGGRCGESGCYADAAGLKGKGDAQRQ